MVIDRLRHSRIYGDLILRLRHATSDVSRLAEALNLPTDRSWLSSDLMDRGPDLPPKTRDENFWSSVIPLYEREFVDEVQDVMDRLMRLEPERRAFVESGGRIEIYLQLNGRRNVGDSLPPGLLARLGGLDVYLDIEVFPNFGGEVLN